MNRHEPKACTVEIYGLVSRPEGLARVAVPKGVYRMRELSIDRYRFLGCSKREFDLELSEVATYMDREMRVVDGNWP